MTLYTCRRCKTPSEIRPSKLRKYDYICDPCLKEENRESLARRKDRGGVISGTRMSREWHREYDRKYRERPDVRLRLCRRAQERQNDPVERPKYEARQAVRNAIRRGNLVREGCEKCGEPAQAHHDDYSKPLDVRWLCPVHHAEIHAKARGENQ